MTDVNEQAVRRLETTIDSIGEAVISTDRDGRIERLNPIAAALTGWNLDDCRGKLLGEVYKLGGDNTTMETIVRVARGHGPVGLVNYATLIRRDGTEIPIADTVSPIGTSAGEIDGVVVVFRDMTQEWAADRERFRLQAARARAEHALLEERLQIRRMEEASRLKSAFLANMSHELRTPLNAIIGFTDLMHRGLVGDVNDKQHEFLGDILTSGRHLLQLINDILDLSKVEAGRLELRPERIDLRALVNEVVQILRTTAAAKEILVGIEIEPDLGEIHLDGSRLKQVLFNYLSNAIKFTPVGGRVGVCAEAHGPLQLRLVVHDTGIGISPADQLRLFVDFQQIESGASKSYGGTGLGLSLTKRLVEAQGGHVGVTSEPGVGRRFHAVLPRIAR